MGLAVHRVGSCPKISVLFLICVVCVGLCVCVCVVCVGLCVCVCVVCVGLCVCVGCVCILCWSVGSVHMHTCTHLWVIFFLAAHGSVLLLSAIQALMVTTRLEYHPNHSQSRFQSHHQHLIRQMQVLQRELDVLCVGKKLG